MKRIIFMVLRLFYIVPYWLFRISVMGKSDKYSELERYNYLCKIIKRVNKAGKVSIISTGLNRLPKEDGFIFFPNHQGMFDVLAILENNKRPFTAVLKKELNEVILVKQVIRLLKALTLDRGNPKDSVRVIRKVTEEVMQGRNYLIFAEGTRSKNGNNLLEFKSGTFKSAINAKCPIVPIALIDAFKPFDMGTISKETVQVHYLDAIYYEEYKDLKSKEVAELVKSRIEETIRIVQSKNVE